MATHPLPKLPAMVGQNRTAQSKSSAQRALKSNKVSHETILHVKGTSNEVKISNGGVAEMTEIKPRRGEVFSSEKLTGLENAATTAQDKNVKRVSGRLKEKIDLSVSTSEVDSPECKKKKDINSTTPDYLLPKRYFQSKQTSRKSLQMPKTDSPIVANGDRSKRQSASAKLTDISDKSGIIEKLKKEPLNTQNQIEKETCVEEGAVDAAIMQNCEVYLPRRILIKPAEVPSPDHIEKLLEGDTESYKVHYPVTLVEGDMKWAKVKGHPYWPCMVSSCPFSKIFTHVKTLGTKVSRLYHVQFFGNECERGWIPEASLMDFNGRAHFLDKANEYQQESLKKKAKKIKAKSNYNPFVVTERRHNAWEIAVSEATLAFALTGEERVKQYKFDYIFVADLKEEKKQMKEKQRALQLSSKFLSLPAPKGKKRKLELDSEECTQVLVTENASKKQKLNEGSPKKQKLNEGSPKKQKLKEGSPKKQKLKEGEPKTPKLEEGDPKTPKLNEGSPKTPCDTSVPFQVYFAAHSSATRKEHPDWDSVTLRINLRREWKAGRLVSPPTSQPAKLKTPTSQPAKLKLPNSEEKDQAQVNPRLCGMVPLKSKKISFAKYYANHSVATRDMYPDWLEDEVRDHLHKQWKAEKIFVSPSKEVEESVASKNSEIQNDTPALVSPDKYVQPTLMDFWKNISLMPVSKNEKEPAKKAPVVSKDCQDISTRNESVPRKRSRKSLVNAEPDNTVPSKDNEAAEASKKKKIGKPALPTNGIATVESPVPSMLSEEQPPLSFGHNPASDSQTKPKTSKEPEPYELQIFKLFSTCKLEKEHVCNVCEKTGETIDCSGQCGQHFHAACVNLNKTDSTTYTCPECLSGVRSCFSCKKADSATKRCSIPSCGKYYHEACVKKYRLTRFESKSFVCPMHCCSTCSVDNIKNPKASKGRFYKCVRCPVSYHVGDFCIPAGSEVLTGSSIICSDHFKPNKALSNHSRMNISWCFTCSKGGTLLCCEACPASFHYECVKVDKTPEEAWYCEECVAGMRPLYGNIIWIKVGIYRWWAGEVCHPRNVPLNIQEMPHQVGEFPVRFFGSHDYYWMHRGRVFLFQEGDTASKNSSKGRRFVEIYNKGVEEATKALEVWTSVQDKKDEKEQERKGKRPAPFKMIKTNFPIGNVQLIKAEISDIPVCECKADGDEPCDSECLNRMMYYECHPASCPAGEKCHNQRFQKRQYVHVEPFKCEGRGWGLKTVEDIKKGQFVIEYVGDLVDEDECKRRIVQAHDDNISNFYMLTLDKNRIIDAGPKGNYSRFMNHSCAPNLITQKWTVNGDLRVGLFALEDITKGSEITFNYNLECLGNEKKACACGAANCSGFLGVRPKVTAANNAKDKSAKELKKKKKKPEQRKIYEDECFRCGTGGELVMCDVTNCQKVYHLQCLKLTKPPTGKWRCPWHHCDICGKHAIKKCIECPDSFCANHFEGNIFEKNGITVCEDHTDMLENPSLIKSTLSSPGLKVTENGNDPEDQAKGHNSSHLTQDVSSVQNSSLINGTADKTPTGPEQKVKRKYVKKIKPAQEDITEKKVPALKISLVTKQDPIPKCDGVLDSSGQISNVTSTSSKKIGVNNKGSLSNGHCANITKSTNNIKGVRGKSKTLNDSDDADSISGLVIDM